MAKRREFIRKSLLGSAGVVFGSFAFKSWSISALTENFSKAAANRIIKPVVETEEVVYQYLPADNGAGPMWCGGSTCLVRVGKDVFASGLETIPERKPFNNCRWMLFERSRKGWEKRLADKEGRTREPGPMATFHDGRFFLSVNPTLTAPDTYNGPARPEILQFKKSGEKLKYEKAILDRQFNFYSNYFVPCYRL